MCILGQIYSCNMAITATLKTVQFVFATREGDGVMHIRRAAA